MSVGDCGKRNGWMVEIAESKGQREGLGDLKTSAVSWEGFPKQQRRRLSVLKAVTPSLY